MTVQRVVIIEDEPNYRASLETFFEHAPDFELIASFGSAEPALSAAKEAGASAWDLVVTDLELPGVSGIEAIRLIKQLRPDVSIVVLTVFEEPKTILEAISAGADGYMLKKLSARELLEQMRAVTGGGAQLTGRVARTLLNLVRELSPESGEPDAPSPTRLQLTEREQQVLRSLVAGHGYKQVAAELDISIDTVRSHTKAIYRKLQVHSIAEAVTRAIRERLV